MFRSLLAAAAVCAAAAAAHELARPLVVNVDHRGLPLQPSFDLHPGGVARFVWNTYANHEERLFTTSFEEGRRSRTQELGAGAGVYWSPIFLAQGEDSGWALWQQRDGREWSIVARRLEAGFWEPITLLSERERNALMPAAALYEDELFAAWEDHDVAPQRIVVRTEGRSKVISQADSACYRPALAATPDSLWALWDCYGGREYGVYARRLEPAMGQIVRISGQRNSMDAAALYGSSSGLVAVWVAEEDVLGKGALDQHHYVEAANFDGERWSPPVEVADLAHSLLSRIEPEVGPIWGYAGRRLHPLLLEDDGAVWALWERKIEHAGRSTLPGELSGRRFDGLEWAAPRQLHDNLVRYEIPAGASAHDGVATLLGFDTQHNLEFSEVDLRSDLPPTRETKLTGWRPVELPLPHWEQETRPSIEIDGVRHWLYWGDLHVHTGLTPDAEGEVDELMHFARDKALLDVVVMQENDASSWLDVNPQGAYRGQVLSDSEYALSVYFSRRYTEEGRFVALPGWEWSDRTDDGEANHRTVIFAGDDTPLLRHAEEDDFTTLCDIVEAAGGVMNTQHPTFRLVDRPCDGNIEVASGWGVYINQPEKIHADLSAGYEVGFVATSDGHRRNPGTGGGLTGFWAPELTSAEILRALEEHRVYATNGSRVTLDARANGAFMGSDIESDGEVLLTLQADAPRPIVRAALIRDGAEILVSPGRGRSLRTQYRDEPGEGFHWYYWRVELEGESPDYPANIKVAEGHLAWTSPHRVTVRRK